MHLTNSCAGDGKCVICDSYVRPCTLVRICDECNYGSYQGRCVICGGPGVSDAYYCKECTVQEKDVRAFFFLFKQLCSSGLSSISTWWSLVPVVQKLDNAIHWINSYPLDNAIVLSNTYSLDSDLFIGLHYLTFEQPEAGA